MNLEVARGTLNSVVGLPYTGMMKMKGVVNTQEVIIVMECGVTHNFICANVVEDVDLPFYAMQNYIIILGNGIKIPGAKVCKDVPIMLIVQDFLPLEFSADIILGVRLLQTLGLVNFNFATRMMKFRMGERVYHFYNDSSLVKARVSM